MTWTPDPAFAVGSHVVTELQLCQLRLQDDARFPWLILLPRVPHAVELTDLSSEDRARLSAEIDIASLAVRRLGEYLDLPVDKLNVAALGNVTAQLHVHVIGRRRDDPVWPDPVWGRGVAQPWGERLPQIIAALAPDLA